MPVAERFVSINGEGACAGKLAAFVRFAGCNLRCGYCDTMWANVPGAAAKGETPEQLAAWVRQIGVECVTLTGGEPVLQPLLPQLVELLEAQGIRCERKSVYSDIEALGALGYDIKLRRGRGGGYFLASRTFDLAELKLLVDAVQSSRVISKSTSDKLIKKLEGLTSHYEGSQLQRQVYVDGRPKSANKELPYSVDALFSAINKGRMVQFRYKKVGRPETRTISPWQMVWENGCYYLIAYQDEKSPAGIRHYRVDKMAGVLVLDAPRRGKAQFAGFDLPSYLKKHFNMYGGPEHSVTLRCTADLEPAMRERFGASPILIPEGETHFHFTVPICVSDQFYGWVCGFGGKVEITAPAAVRSGLQEMTSRIAQAHQPV